MGPALNESHILHRDKQNIEKKTMNCFHARNAIRLNNPLKMLSGFFKYHYINHILGII